MQFSMYVCLYILCVAPLEKLYNMAYNKIPYCLTHNIGVVDAAPVAAAAYVVDVVVVVAILISVVIPVVFVVVSVVGIVCIYYC